MNILEAKRVKLNDNLDKTIHQIVDAFFDRVEKGKVKKKTKIGEVKIRIADGTEGLVKVYIEPNMKSILGFEAFAFMDTEENSSDPNKLYISINPKFNKDKTSLYNSLYHEFLHATDPVFTSKFTEKFMSTYDPDIDENYWAHQIEFRAIPNEILNAMVNEFKNRKNQMRSPSDLKELIKANNNILNHFSYGEELSNLSKMIFQSMFRGAKTKNILSMIARDYPSTASLLPTPTNDLTYLDKYLANIKKFGGKKWVKFLSMLYSTHEEIMELLSE